MRRIALSLICALAVAGCGGGSHGAPPPAPVHETVRSANASFVFTVPRGGSGSSAKRTPKWLTAAVKTLTVQVVDVKDHTSHADLTSTVQPSFLAQQSFTIPSSSGDPSVPGQCGPDPSNAQNLTCTANFIFPVGDDTVAIAALDAPAGRTISQQTLVAWIQPGVLSKVVAVLDATIGNATFSSSDPSLTQNPNGSFNLAGNNDVTVRVNLPDVHGTQIDFTKPGTPLITAISQTPSALTATASGGTITLHPIAGGSPISVAVRIAPPNSAGTNPGDGVLGENAGFTVTLLRPTGSLYVLSSDLANVYPESASGSPAPQRQITGLYSQGNGANGTPHSQGGFVQQPIALAAGAGNTFEVLMDTALSIQPPNNFVWVFGPTANGPASPQGSFSGNGGNGGLSIARVPGTAGWNVLAWNSSGNDVVEEFNGSTGSFPAFSTTTAALPGSIVVDAAGQIYVGSVRDNTVTVYAANAGGNAAPLRTISLNQPTSLAIGADGTLYVAVSTAGGQTAVAEYAPGATQPFQSLGPFGSPPGSLSALAVDSLNELYVAFDERSPDNQTNIANSIAVFAPRASGAATPIRTLQNPISPTNPPGGSIRSIAVDP